MFLINALNKCNADMHQANSLPFDQQVCRSVKENVVATVTSFDAIPFNRHRTMWHHDQYTKPIIERELRKCMVAMRAPFDHCQREFVTGNWGCGCFCGDMELKFMIQWISSSISPSIAKVIFCPFDRRDLMEKKRFFDLVHRYAGKASVNSVLRALTEDPGYMEASTTIEYLLSNNFDHHK